MWHPIRSLSLQAGLAAVAALLCGWGLAQTPLQPAQPGGSSETPPPGVASGPKAEGKPDESGLRREGTELVDQVGQFKVSRARTIFVMAQGNRQLVALENLNLERVVKMVSGNPEASNWVITGTVTENRGNNYLLVRRAVLKSQAKP